MRKMMMVETKLYLRDPVVPVISLLLPVALLLGLGGIPGLQETLPELGGQRVIDTQLPGMMTLLAVTTLAFTVLPATLATYRGNGVLRRLATTPVRPSMLLTVQLVLNLGFAVVAGVALIVSGHLVHGIAIPRQMAGFVLVFLLGTASLFAIGLVIAAFAPDGKSAPGFGTILMFPLLFVGGMWIPRETMPIWLRQIGDYLPVAPFGQALRDTWSGALPYGRDLLVLALTLLVAGVTAARFFRWE